MFGCSGAQIYDPEVMDEGSGQPSLRQWSSLISHDLMYYLGLKPIGSLNISVFEYKYLVWNRSIWLSLDMALEQYWTDLQYALDCIQCV